MNDDAEEAAEGQEKAVKKRGRPPGSRNRRSVNWVQEWNQRYGSSLERLWPIATGDPVKVAKRLRTEFGISAAEALQHIRWAVETLAQYQHQRIGLAKGVAVESDAMHLHLLAVKAANAPGVPPDLDDGDAVEQAKRRREHLRAMEAAQAAVDARDEVLPDPMEQAGRRRDPVH
jgi:hypothetical protein